ncbi:MULTISPECIES: LuxR C-terminal-related transcriptional regulator [unclassified Paenibacillus]|uniref:LuxR C-terminal-related transcriptional regulator n=1 Tax=unclassified Paenibacillus TaxID=185978 RepID=UPI00363F0DEF
MIVRTKLHIPHVRRDLVARPRLIHKLNEGMKVKLTHVSAQAGYGKTTALSEWAKQCGALVAWLSLDIRDNDYIQFWSGVTASIQERIPSFGAEVSSFLEKGLWVALEHALPALLNDLNRLTSELAIVLDDYQFIEHPSIHDSLIYFLERLPSHIHLYLASRSELAIPTAKLLVEGEYNQITMQDLRFQLDEGLIFFRDTTDLRLTSEQVAELHHQTEGWISGLELAAISLKHSVNIAESIHQFNGQHHHISEYLLEEVFRHQSEGMRSFLMATSILSRMNQSLCQAVTGQSNSQQYLERLEQLNLFVIPLDDQRNWYRYHHLFSEFLQRMGSRTHPDKWVQVHREAATWLESHGLDDDAMEHYLAGKHYADAVRLIEKNLHTLVQSHSVVLMRWVSALPENSFAEKPMVELFYISVLLGVEEWEAAFTRIERAEARFQTLKGRLSDVEWNKVMGNIYFFCAVSAYLQRDLVKTSEYYELVEQYMPEGSFFQTMRRNRYHGYDSFCDHLSYINDLHAADAFLSKWAVVLGRKTNYPFAGVLLASYSKLLYEWNRLEEAELYASQALERRDIKPFARVFIQVAIGASQIQQTLGNASRASELLAELKSQIASPDSQLFMSKIEAEQACLALRQGAVEEALDWMQGCGLAHKDEVSLFHVLEYLALARVLVAGGQLEEALDLLGRLNQLLHKEDRLRDRIKVLILQSVTLKRLGRTETALAQLETALELAEPEGYVRSFVDEGAEMFELLSAYLKTESSNLPPKVSLAYLRQLIQALQVTPEESMPLIEILTEQETNVLHLIADGLSNKDIAHRLIIAGETVKSHIKNIYKKLNVNNRVRVLQRARELGILG